MPLLSGALMFPRDSCHDHLPPPRSFQRFALVGIANTIFSFSFFPLLYWSTSDRLSFDVILIISYVVCHAIPFLTHRYLTFRSRGGLGQEIAKYALVAILTYAANKLLLWLIADHISSSVLISQLFISALLFGPSYVLFDRIVFIHSRPAAASIHGN